MAINSNNMQYYPYFEDIAYYALGLLMSIDDNVLLGATQKVVGLFDNSVLPYNNYFYESGKVLGDTIFLSAFNVIAGISTQDAINSANSAEGLLDLKPFAGTLNLEVGGEAVVEVVKAAGNVPVAVIAGAGAAHSKDVLDADIAKLDGTNETGNSDQSPWNVKIMNYIKDAPISEWFVKETQDGKLHTFFDLGGFYMENGIYHARQDALQQYGGYYKVYDDVFKLACSMGSLPFDFVAEAGTSFRIWLWKGDYLNLGAGAEIGIYYNQGPLRLCGTQYAMPMTLNLINKKTGIPIFNWNPPKTENDW